MQLGIVTPIVNMNPRFEAPAWERDGVMADVVAVAREGERLGYGWVSCPEHIAIPEEVASVRGGRYWDPLVTLSFVAAGTSTIGLLTHVLVLGYHHPLEIVKRYGTLDNASGGRVILGVGVGSLEAEFELLGAPFEGRGRGPTTRCAPSAPRSAGASPATTASTTATGDSSSNRAASIATCRSGWGDGPDGRCGGRSSSPTAGSPSG